MKKLLIILLIIMCVACISAVPALAGMSQDFICEEYAPVLAQASADRAPNTGDVGIIISAAVLLVTAFITIRLTKHKNRT